MKTLSLFPISICLLFAASPLLADEAVMPPPAASASASDVAAEPQTGAESAPNLSDQIEEGETGVDVRSYQREDGTKITEYAVSGQVYKVKVEPAGNLPAYYLYRNSSGQFERRLPGGKTQISPPNWIIKEF